MLTWVLVLLAGVIAVPLVIEATRKPMSEKLRKNAPGQFAKLPQGETHYQWHGPEDGPICVCIHGLTTPSFVWRGLTPHLVEMGFRVLTYDHIGRGYSDRKTAPQSPDFFVSHLDALLENQKIEDDLTLVGYSMGGAVATAFAVSQPVAVKRVILLAPAGMHRLGDGLLRFMITTPVIGTWLMLALYPTILRRGIDREKKLPTSVPDITTLQDAELNIRGFVPAVLSSLRNMLDKDLEQSHRLIGHEKIPVLAIWGRDDTVIPLSSAETLSEWNPSVQNVIIDDAGHGVTYTHTDQVVSHIAAFVRDTD